MNNDHVALMALRTLAERPACEVFVTVAVVCFRHRSGIVLFDLRHPEQVATHSKLFLAVDEVDRVLATCDEQSPVGKRDRAILLLLLRLALRAGEVAHLRFSDVDWRAGEVRIVSAKSARERKLPLPSEVGQALVDYLQNSRPNSAEPYIFLRIRAPFNPVTGCSTVSCITRRNLDLRVERARLQTHSRHTDG